MLSLDVILRRALDAGLAFGLIQLVLVIFFLLLAGKAWQRLIGPAVTVRWPQFGQHDDDGRPSFLPEPGSPNVYRVGLRPFPWTALLWGSLQGLQLAVLAQILPAMGLVFVLLIFAIRCGVAVYHWPRNDAPGQTDLVFYVVRDALLMVAGLWLVVRIAGSA